MQTKDITIVKDLYIYPISGNEKLGSDSYRLHSCNRFFLKPYSTSKEFETDIEPLLISIFYITPPGALVFGGFAALSIAALTAAAVCEIATRFNKDSRYKGYQSLFLEVAEKTFTAFCQTILNAIFLPLLVLSMATRLISTGVNTLTESCMSTSPK